MTCEPRTFRYYKKPRDLRPRPAATSSSSKPVKHHPRLIKAQIDPSESLPSSSATDKSPSRDDTDRSACIEAQQYVSAPQTTVSLPVTPPPLSGPSDLGNHPQNSFLWSFFIIRGTKIFLCWDVGEFGLNELINDPFTTTLSPMAAQSEVLRFAALALSAFLYNQDCPGSLRSHEIIAFKDAALATFRRENVDLQSNPIAYILASLMLQLIDMDHDQRLWSVTQKAIAYLLEPTDNPSRDAAMHLSRWIYICRQLSFSNNIDLKDEVTCQELQFHDMELESSFCRQFRAWVTHPLYTVSHRWINPLLKLSKLMHIQQNAREAGVVGYPGDITLKMNDLEDEISNARQQDLLAFLRGSEDLPDLADLNEALYAAITLVFFFGLG